MEFIHIIQNDMKNCQSLKATVTSIISIQIKSFRSENSRTNQELTYITIKNKNHNYEIDIFGLNVIYSI